MASIRKSLAISFSEKYATLLIQFLSTLIIARLLTPDDIGLFTVGAAVVGFAHMIRDFGVSNYIVQEKDLTNERLKTAFGTTLIIAWSTAGVLFILSEPLGKFYNDNGVSKVISILAISFFFIPFSSTVLGLLRRELEFDKILLINLSSTFVHALVGCLLAFLSWGFESLAWATLASAATTVTASIILRPKRAVFTPSLRDFKRVFSFGSYATASSVTEEAGASAPDLAVGKMLGLSELGYYSRALGFVSIFNHAITSAISPIIVPAFAKTSRNEQQLKQSYLKAINYYSGLAWPFLIFVAAMASPLIQILYGEQWSASIELAQILCLAFFFKSLSAFSSQVLVATGQIKLHFWIQVFLQVPRLGATIAASLHSIHAVILVQVTFYAAAAVTYHFFVERKICISIRELAKEYRKSLHVSLACLLSISAFNLLVQTENSYLESLVAAAVFSVTWVVSLYIIRHEMRQEISNLATKIGI